MIRSCNYFYLVLVMILILQLCRSAGLSTAPETKRITDDEDSTRSTNNFVRFQDLGKGGNVSGLSKVKQSLLTCGYNLATRYNFTDLFDEDFESAVIYFQTKLGLQVTRKLDSQTISSILRKCGVSDVMDSFDGMSHFVYMPGKPKWPQPPPITLTYAFSPQYTINSLSTTQISSVFRSAFSRWAAVVPISFKETDEYETADIKIGFYRGEHGNAQAFDGALGTLAHAFEPEDARIHLDADEQWVTDLDGVDSEVAIDLETVVIHEIGHTLGMAHSLLEEAIMYAYIQPRSKKVILTQDDIQGVQALYGSNPNFYPDLPIESGGLSYGVSNWIVSLVILVGTHVLVENLPFN